MPAILHLVEETIFRGNKKELKGEITLFTSSIQRRQFLTQKDDKKLGILSQKVKKKPSSGDGKMLFNSLTPLAALKKLDFNTV